METQKIVINQTYGGFDLSYEALHLLELIKGYKVYSWDLCRWDPDLINVIEELGERANSDFSALEIIEVEKGRKFIIDEYDGLENLVFASEVEWICFR